MKRFVMAKNRILFMVCGILILLMVGFLPAAIAQDEPIELLFWDTFSADDMSKAEVVDRVIEDYEAAHPNVRIVRETQDFQNMITLINTALASGTGPDIILYAPGAGFMGPLVEAELLLELDEYAETFGWLDRMYPWTWESVTFNDHIYAVGHELEMIGVYYNTEIFAELGVSEPETYEEFLAICQAALDAGYIPLAFANRPGWPAYHMFSSFANVLAGADGMDAVFAGEAKWNDPPFVQAIQMAFVDLSERGYFIPSPNAVDYPEGNELFYNGQAAMHHTGMWLYDRILTNSDFEVDFFALPGIGDMPPLPPGGMGSALMISSATDHPDEAAAFVDAFFSDEMVQLWYEVALAIPPVDVDPAGFELEALFRGFVDTIRAASLGGSGLGYNIDVLTPPEFNTVMNQGFQAVINGERTPQAQADALQAAWEAYYGDE
jgi:raffinose/stachyose/melibiose transport system substrate-binding protein